jgi:hypothetical protein
LFIGGVGDLDTVKTLLEKEDVLPIKTMDGIWMELSLFIFNQSSVTDLGVALIL